MPVQAVIFVKNNDGIMSGKLKTSPGGGFLPFTFKFLNLTLAITTLAVTGSCSKSDYPHDAVLATPPEHMSSVVLSYGSTKVPGTGIDRVDIFCFEDNEAGILDTFTRIDNENREIMEIYSGFGRRRIVVVANAAGEYFHKIRSYGDLVRTVWNSDMEREGHPVMTGQTTCETGGKILVPVQQIQSTVRIESIRKTIEIDNLRCFLKNVNKTVPLLPAEDYSPTDIYDTKPVAAEGGVSFKCYPNDVEEEGLGNPFTRLVLAGEINDTTWYWPINVNRRPYGNIIGKPGIGRGSEYGYSITITKKGVLDPDLPIWLGDASITLHPGQLIFARTGDSIHVYCETNPEWTELDISQEDLEHDANEGIYEYSMDKDGKGVTLHLLRGGTGMFTIDAGYPVNKGFLVLVVCDP